MNEPAEDFAQTMIGVDIGGTFTDVAVVTPSRVMFAKVPSVPAEPERGVIDGLRKIERLYGISPGEISRLVQGTTVSTNALLEGKGADTALITTRGFEDVLEIGRQNRSSLPGDDPIYDLQLQRPAPLVPRRHRLGVRGRISYRYGEIQPLNEQDAVEAALRIRDAGIDSVAVCTLGSYLDPRHEERIRDIFARLHPDAQVTLSSEVLPEFREYERTSTTVINAYLRPVMNRYLNRLEDVLAEGGVDKPPQVMLSNGGITTAAGAGERAVYTLLSGPAAGVTAAAHVAQFSTDQPRSDLLTLDIGGTSTDVSLISNGKPSVTSEGSIGGHPVRTPMVDINTIGQGGGSIVQLDPAGAITVGPESAGADPGPVCYGRGGTRPTLTDAHLLLGHLDPEARLGGEISLDYSSAREAFAREIAAPLDLSVEQACQGAVDIAISAMKRAAGVISVEKGHDPRDFTLVAFGGAGPLYGLRLAKEMSIPRVLIPRGPGVLSALGLLTADVRHDFVQSHISPLGEVKAAKLGSMFEQLFRRGVQELDAEGFEPAQITGEFSVDLRYVGQAYELSIPLGKLSAAEGEAGLDRLWPGAEALADSFHRAHEKTYSHSAPKEPVELINLRVAVTGRVSKPSHRPHPSSTSDSAPVQMRTVYFPRRGFVDTPCYRREQLSAEVQISGPAVISETVSTTLVPPGFSIRCDSYGNLIATNEMMHQRSCPPPAAAEVDVDPTTVQVLRNAFISITEEMGMTLRRIGYSPNIKEREDCSAALFDADCRIIAQADYPLQPGHLGAMIYSVREAVRAFPPESLRRGDVIIQNDPHKGGNHLPDVTLITPLFVDEKLCAFAANRAHHSDIGGAVPGSISGTSTEIYQEGFIIPPLKLFCAGEANQAIMELMRANVRTPDERIGDLRAQMAANARGRDRFRQLCERYGSDVVQRVFDRLIDYSERRMRHEIERIPDGTYRFSDQLDDDGVTREPVQLVVEVTVDGSDITFDFSESAPQTLGPMNATEAITAGSVYYTLRCLTDPSIPPNAGCYRPVSLVTPRGTVTNPRPPAAVVGGNLETAQRLCDVLIGALSQALPDRAIAACCGQMCNVGMGGTDPAGSKQYAYYETIGGGLGARFSTDGIDGIHCHMTNTMNTPVEALEIAYPFLVTHYCLIPDTGGPGRFRGGLGIRRDYQVIDHETTFSILAERRRTRPYGLFGGKPASSGRDLLDPGTPAEKVIPGKHTVRLKPGQLVSIHTPGGGGYGDPLNRDPQAVLTDLLDGRISYPHARKQYGVILTEDGRIDEQGTCRLRQNMRGPSE